MWYRWRSLRGGTGGVGGIGGVGMVCGSVEEVWFGICIRGTFGAKIKEFVLREASVA